MIYNPYFDGRRKPPDIPDDAEYNEVDQYGRRFRKIGNCIEYEPEINGMPRSVFFASQKAQKQQEEETARGLDTILFYYKKWIDKPQAKEMLTKFFQG